MTVARRGMAADLGMPGRVPTQPVEIDWSHPLANGLIACYVPGGARGAVDLTGIGPLVAIRSGSSIAPSSYGAALGSFATSPGAFTGTIPSAWKLTTGGTIFSAIELTGTPVASSTIFGLAYNSAGTSPFNDYVLSFNGSAQPNFSYNHGGTFASVQSTGASLGVGRHTVAGSFVVALGGAIAIYQDGAVVKTGTWAAAPPPSYTGGGYLQIAGDNSVTSRIINGSTAISLIYNRPLSAAEVAALDRDPFCMLRPIRSGRVRPSSGSSVTVTPGLGLVTVTGRAPTASAGATVAAGLGRTTITGKAPTVGGGVTASPGKGGVLIAGHAPAIATGVSVAAGKGQVTVAGFVPTVITTSGSSVTVTPGLGHVVIGGYAPQVIPSGEEEAPKGGAADRRKKKKRKPARVLKSLSELSEVVEVYAGPVEAEAPAPQINAPKLSDLMRRLDAERVESGRLAAEIAGQTAARQAIVDAALRDRKAQEDAATARKAAEAAHVVERQRRAEFVAAQGARAQAIARAWDDLLQRKQDEDEEDVEQLILSSW